MSKPLKKMVVAGYSATQGDGPWVGVLDEPMIDGRSPLLIARGAASVLGGVTRTLLASSVGPHLFLAH